MPVDSGNIPAEYFGAVSTSGHQAGAFSLREERDERRINLVLTMAVVAVSVAAAAGAQSEKAMHQPSKGDTMSMTYTGCVESVKDT
jgi:hypothetical protein